MSALELEKWVARAEADYEAALDLARRRKHPLPAEVCFHCQQCAEKYLKAFLVARGVPFPRIHDLIALKNLCVVHEGAFELIHDLLDSLSGYDVAVRYPGEVATPEDARDAVRAMRKVRRFVRAVLGPGAS
jgi:HEPN domain-containing protein